MLIEETVADDAVRSGVHRAARRLTLSERLWDLDWSNVLPWQFDGAVMVRSTYAEASSFMTAHYADIFGRETRFFVEGASDAKRRFWDEMDVFAFRADDEVVGIAAGHPTDWSTYYVRTLALLPAVRERRITSGFTQNLSDALRSAGVARWEADTSPANTPMIRMFSRAGFVVTSTLNSERWGAMLRFTKFLREDAQATFHEQFTSIPAFGRNPPRPMKGGSP